MRTLSSLKREATGIARWRGHKQLAPWVDGDTDGRRASRFCNGCQGSVSVNRTPEPNGIDIGGSLVAVGCKRGIEP